MIGKREILLAHLNSFLCRLNLKSNIVSIYRYYITYRNFAKVFTHRIFNKFPVEAYLRDGRRVILNDSTTAYYYSIFYFEFKGKIEINSSLLEFEYNGKRVRVYGWKYGDLASAFIFRDEGCEYELFKTVTNDTLSKFSQIVVEYHYGYKKLIKRLKNANFKVKRSTPIHIRNNKI